MLGILHAHMVGNALQGGCSGRLQCWLSWVVENLQERFHHACMHKTGDVRGVVCGVGQGTGCFFLSSAGGLAKRVDECQERFRRSMGTQCGVAEEDFHSLEMWRDRRIVDQVAKALQVMSVYDVRLLQARVGAHGVVLNECIGGEQHVSACILEGSLDAGCRNILLF